MALVVKNPPASAGVDVSSVPGSGRSSGGEHGNPLQYSCPENPMDNPLWQATVCGVIRVGHDSATKLLLLEARPRTNHHTGHFDCVLLNCINHSHSDQCL